MNNRILLITIACALLSSCGLYRQYEREEMHFVDSLYRRMSVPNDTVSSASVTWEEFFTDKYLQEWIHIGLQYNSDLSIARLKVKEAEAALLASRWALLPGADFGMRGGLPGQFSASLEASWQTDIFGSEYAQASCNKERVLASIKHAGKIIYSSIGIRTSDTLYESGNYIIMHFSSLIIYCRIFLQA